MDTGLGQMLVREAMVTAPKTHGIHLTVQEARAAFVDDHVHMLLLISHDNVLRGTLVRSDLEDARASDGPAMQEARLRHRVVHETSLLADAASIMAEAGIRRLAVVDDDHRLSGLLCLKRRLDGYCSDADVIARAGDRDGASGPSASTTACTAIDR